MARKNMSPGELVAKNAQAIVDENWPIDRVLGWVVAYREEVEKLHTLLEQAADDPAEVSRLTDQLALAEAEVAAGELVLATKPPEAVEAARRIIDTRLAWLDLPQPGGGTRPTP